MLSIQLLFVSSLLPLISAETVLGAYIFHRHGDRTSKEWPPTSLTDLGFQQVWQAGNYYRGRYIDSTATSPIYGIASDVAVLSQLSVEAPVDNVLQNSAAGFLQGLYPPVGATLGSQTLANGSTVEAPNNGFQLIPVNIVASAATASAEGSTWLQGASGCENAIVSSNDYFFSTEYEDKLTNTKSFYESILPVINTTFTSVTGTFKNAYTIFDYVHVSVIHNASDTIPSDSLLTNETLYQLRTLADNHEYNLAYNASEPIRAVAGSTLAAQILQALNVTITGESALPLSIQFGAYGSFLSFFGLAQLPAVSANFTGLVDYASAMIFELVTNATVTNTSYPSVDDISVRFLFVNGTAAANPLNEYPLFGQSDTLISWTDFQDSMNEFAIGDQATWCSMCGNTTGVCASTTTSSSSSGSSSASSSTDGGSGGISKAVAGVIGAMVTLAVILGLEALIMVFGCLRLVNKKKLGGVTNVDAGHVPKA